MSPMVDIQRRHATVFRIRLGHTVQSANGRSRPEKLTDQIRITAPGKRVVEAFTEVYGGEVQRWGDQYEAYLPTNQLRVMILPGQSIEQWWEKWKGSVCERRCSGVTETKSGGPCVCPADIDERLASKDACQPMTRVNVLCPDVKVLGSGSLVTHSMIAAETLPQAIAVAEEALRRGVMVPAVLKVVEHKSRNHFIYPQLIVHGYSLEQLESGAITQALPAAGQPAPVGPGEAAARGDAPAELGQGEPAPTLDAPEPAAPPFEPVPAEAQRHAPASSVADQLQANAERPTRRRSQVDIPDPGLPEEDDAEGVQAGEALAAEGAGEEREEREEPAGDWRAEPPSSQQLAKIHALYGQLGIDEEEYRLVYRNRWQASSAKELTRGVVSDLIDWLEAGGDGDLQASRAEIFRQRADAQRQIEDGSHPGLPENRGSASAAPGTETGGTPAAGAAPEGGWRRRCRDLKVHALTGNALARRVAEACDLDWGVKDLDDADAVDAAAFHETLEQLLAEAAADG